MRLQKYMALCGVAARRKCEEMIAAGRVSVNGQRITEMGTQVEETDEVLVDGVRITPEQEKRYVLYHKPAGEVTTVSDEKGRETVMDRFRDFPVRLYPVGRLDYDSEGLLLLTNDGALAHALLSPRKHVDKVYYVETEGELTREDADAFAQGLTLADGFRCLPAGLRLLGGNRGEVTLQEGKYHQIKRMLGSLGKPVTYLKRVAFGPLVLDKGLKKGEWRPLTEGEKTALAGEKDRRD